MIWFLCCACTIAHSDIASLREEVRTLREEVLQLSSRRLTTTWHQTECPSEVKRGQIESDTPATGSDTIWIIVAGAMVFFMQAGFALLECGALQAKNAQHILLKNLLDVCVGGLSWWLFGFAWAYGYISTKQRAIGECYNTVGYLGSHFAGNTYYALSNIFHFCEQTRVNGTWADAMNGVKVDASAPFRQYDDMYCKESPVPTVEDANILKNWFFQWAFCATSATIVSGGVAERIQLPAYILISLCMSGFIYPIVVSWTWSGNGWATSGDGAAYYDFAGSGVVHLTGGIGALIGAIMVGPRSGRFDSSSPPLEPHSVPLVVLGTLILWFGWYGFNPGSTLGMEDGKTALTAALAAVNTTISACVCGLVSFIIEMIKTKGKYDLTALCNGILAGLVSITAGCGNVLPHGAFLIGILGAVVFQSASTTISFLHIDDPLDAFAVHGACGIWGVIAAALFDLAGDGFFYGWGDGSSVWYNESTSKWEGVTKGEQLGQQLITLLAIIGWVGGWCILLFGSLRIMKLLKVNEEKQKSGADRICHLPGSAYRMHSLHVEHISASVQNKPKVMIDASDNANSGKKEEAPEVSSNVSPDEVELEAST